MYTHIYNCRVEKKSAITCLKKNRDYSSSSVPARYIPKKSSQSKKSESSNSETMEVLKRKDFSEFSDASPPLDNEVGYGGNSVRKGFDFDMKSRYRSQMRLSNLRNDGVEQSMTSYIYIYTHMLILIFAFNVTFV